MQTAFSQTTTITLDWNGAQAQGCCDLCGGFDYWCVNNTGGCGTAAATDQQSFFDPVPNCNSITGVTVTYYGSSCDANNINSYIDGFYVGTTVGNLNCSCGSCDAYPSSYSGSISGYVYGGWNTFMVAPDNAFCFEHVDITFSYTNSGSTPSVPAAPSGNFNICSGSSQTYSTSPVSGATSYNWTVPAGWTISSGQGSTSINIIAGSSGGNVCVNASNSCGTSSYSCTTVNVITPPSNPGAISGSVNVCQNTSQTYSVAAGAPSYTWTVPGGWSITSGQGTNILNVTTGGTSGNVCVTANNACGSSSQSCTFVNINATPSVPGAITGNATMCPGDNLNYSIAAVSGATSYTWTVPGGWTINSGQGTTSLNVTAGGSSGNICVTADNSCGASSPSCIAVSLGSAPSMPGSIAGNNTYCPGGSETYSISPVSGATSYTWTVPGGWTINSGQGTTSINVTTTSTTGSVCVTASNACGTSSQSCLNVNVGSAPVTPGSILGANPVCPNSSNNYSISPVSGATSYTWTVPAGWVITSGQGTISINATSGASGGNLCVIAENSCGSSPQSCLAVTVSNSPAAPGMITGAPAVCANSTQSYSCTVVPGATSYNWTISSGTINSGQGTNTVSVTFSTSSSSLCVTASNTCGTSTPTCLSVSISPNTVGGVTSSSADTVCSGSNSGTITLSGNTGAVIKWQQSTDGGVSWSDISNTTTTLSFNNITGTTIYRAIVQSGTCSPDTSSTVTVIVAGAANPGTLLDNATFCGNPNGDTLQLVGYAGVIDYWQSSIDNGATWDSIANIDDTLIIANLTLTTWYRVVLQGGGGGNCPNNISPVAVITVFQTTAAGTTLRDTTVCSGANTGTLYVTGQTGTIVNWEFSIDGGSTWVVMSNSDDSLVYINLTKTTMFRVKVQSGTCSSGYSTPATVTVDEQSNGGYVASNASVCSGSNGDTLVLTGYTGNILGWAYSINGGVSWLPIFNITNTQIYNNLNTTTIYSALVQNGVCPYDTALPAIIVVDSITAGGAVTSDATVCSSSNNGTLTLSGYSGNILGWEISTDGGTTWVNITNTTSTQNYTNLTTTTLYRGRVESGGCGAAYSSPATITVVPESQGGVITGGSNTVCSDTNSGTLTLAGYVGNILYWQTSTDGGLTWTTIANTDDTLNYSNLTSSTIFRVVVQSGICSADTSKYSFIVVNPVSAGGTVVIDDTVCSGSNTGMLILIGQTGSIINWEFSVDGGSTWSVLSNSTDTLVYIDITQTTSYRAKVQNGVCTAAYSTPVTITVDDTTNGGMVLQSATVCSAGNSDTLTLTGYKGTILDWEYSPDGGTTWLSLYNTASTQNYSGLTSTAIYRAIVKNGVCPSAYSATATISVDAAAIGGQVVSSTAVCSGSNKDTLNLTLYSGTVQNWEYSRDGGNTWFILSGTNPYQIYSNLTVTDGDNDTLLYRAIVGNGVCPDQQSVPATIIVQTPSAGGIMISDTCYPDNINNDTLLLTGYNGKIKRWEYSNDGGGTWFALCEIPINNPNSCPDTHSYVNLTQTTLFRAIVKNGVCPSDTSDFASIIVLTDPTIKARDDDTLLKTDESVAFLVTANDSGAWQSISILLPPKHGTANVSGQPGMISYVPASSYAGQDTMTYLLCKDCECDTAKIIFTVGVYIPNGFSPDGDALNDQWVITGLTLYPENDIQVYNRWGDLIFKSAPYQSDWDGSSKNAPMKLIGDKVIEGTYFYILNLSSQGPSFHGFVEIRRKQ